MYLVDVCVFHSSGARAERKTLCCEAQCSEGEHSSAGDLIHQNSQAVMLLTQEFTQLEVYLGVARSDGWGARVGALRTGQRKPIGDRPDPETVASLRSKFGLQYSYIARMTVL